MIKPDDVKVETMRGQGPGGQRKNKTETCVRLTHIPTGVQVTIDGRSQAANMRKARKLLATRLAEAKAEAAARDRKARRDDAIRNGAVIRTYDYKRKVVKDHRSGKTASLKEVLDGHLEDIRYRPPREEYE